MTVTTHTGLRAAKAVPNEGAGAADPDTLKGALAAPLKSSSIRADGPSGLKHDSFEDALSHHKTEAGKAKLATGLQLRQPIKQDGYAIHQLISQCPPLDLNSVYTYLLLSEHFSATCVLADNNGRLDGFVSGYLHPEHDDVLFVWQVAVHERARGVGLGQRMLRALLTRPGLENVRYVETTVGPDNAASRGMFRSLAAHFSAATDESTLFDSHLFGPEGHEDECLIRIGPITRKTKEEQHHDS